MASRVSFPPWKFFETVSLVFFFRLITVVDSACSSDDGDDDSKTNRQQSMTCWYELWYFWLIVLFAAISLFIVILFYCKHHVKRATGDSDRQRTLVLTMPAGPPRYEEPGHHPPPYHIATSMGNPQSPQQQAHLPGYVNELLYYDGMGSFSSTVSIGALSQPPPYSPPPTASLRPQNS